VGDKDKLGAKLSPEDKKAIEEAVDKAVSWMDANKDASVEDFKAQKKQLEEVAQPIISKLYAGQAPPPGQEPPTAGSPPDQDARDEL